VLNVQGITTELVKTDKTSPTLPRIATPPKVLRLLNNLPILLRIWRPRQKYYDYSNFVVELLAKDIALASHVLLIVLLSSLVLLTVDSIIDKPQVAFKNIWYMCIQIFC